MAWSFPASEAVIGNNSSCFVIAEIGQNHQGDIDIAKKLIKAAKESGADCVKFQKTCLNEKFTRRTLESTYIGRNSWGNTYGEHKSYLEFNEEQFRILQKTAEDNKILFTASAMDPISLEFLISLKVPFIKIGSGDADNVLLIEKAASFNVPLIISTGMQTMERVDKIYNVVKKHHLKFALLQCVSSYPTPPEEANLKVISTYKEKFPDIVIGYSGHEVNYNLTLAAVALGAKIVERHITFNKEWKGNDHKCSLTPQEFKNLVEGIREIEKAMGTGTKSIQLCEKECFNKLGKCLVAAKCLSKGSKIQMPDLKAKVAQTKGISPCNVYEVIGKTLKSEKMSDQVINEEDLE